MPKGINVDVRDGDATITVDDPDLTSVVVSKLLQHAACPGEVRTVTVGARRGFRVPLEVAKAARLIDRPKSTTTRRAG